MRLHGYQVVWLLKREPRLIERVKARIADREIVTPERRYEMQMLASTYAHKMRIVKDMQFEMPLWQLKNIFEFDCDEVSHGGTLEGVFHVEHLVRYWLWINCRYTKKQAKPISSFYMHCDLGVSNKHRHQVGSLCKEIFTSCIEIRGD